MSVKRKLFYRVALVLLALGLVVSLAVIKRQQDTIAAQHDVIRLNSAYCYMRDYYLKGDGSDRALLGQLNEFLSFEDENLQAVEELILAVQNVAPMGGDYQRELSAQVDALPFFTDTRGGTTYAVPDHRDQIDRLIGEIYQQAGQTRPE